MTFLPLHNNLLLCTFPTDTNPPTPKNAWHCVDAMWQKRRIIYFCKASKIRKNILGWRLTEKPNISICIQALKQRWIPVPFWQVFAALQSFSVVAEISLFVSSSPAWLPPAGYTLHLSSLSPSDWSSGVSSHQVSANTPSLQSGGNRQFFFFS